jgi:protein-S-isoprenylcysteine O-methyltransferase Ste14
LLERLIVIILPVSFLTVLYGGELVFKHKKIDQGGTPPIDKGLFLVAKYTILIPWAGMILQSFGVNVSPLKSPEWLRGTALGLWAAGFGLLFVGRFGLGSSFRVGCPGESTALKAGGLYRFSRNPMYLGMYGTQFAPALYTGNPLFLLIAIFVVVVHHRIILGEEVCLQKMFGQPYLDYCRRVRRYI